MPTPLKKKGFLLQRKGAHFEKIRRRATLGEIIFAVTRAVQHGLYTSNLLPTPMLITLCEKCSDRLAVCHL